MSTVDKMLIKGIRSFDPENKNVITFFKPLTLIVGSNGAGKTTIIECLKVACTGELPPNARSGHSFVHDPKVAGETETKGQIKLRFKTAARKDVVCIRSFQLTQKATKMEYKAIESVLQTINPHTGEKVCLSYRCADMDREIPALMGVSKAVLENVIFVHQDEANWPLQDPSTLKKKFDDIFSATRYTKALEVIKKLHKDQAQEIKTYKLKLENVQTLKDAAYKLRESIAQDQEKTEVLKSQMEELQKDIQNSDSKIHHNEAILKELRKLQEKIATKTAERSTLVKETDKQYRALAEENDDTDEELMEWNEKFGERIAILTSKVGKLGRELTDIASKITFLRESMPGYIREISKLENEAEDHETLKRDRNLKLQTIFKKHNLGVVPNVPFSDEVALNLSARVRSRLMDLDKDLADKKKSIEAELKVAWDRYVHANDRWKDIEAQKNAKAEIKKGILKGIEEKENERRELDLMVSSVDLTEIDKRENDLYSKLKKITDQLAGREFDLYIPQKESEVKVLEQKIKALHRDKDVMAADSAVRVELSLKKVELEKHKQKLKKILDDNKDKFRGVLKGRLPLEKDLRKEILKAQSDMQSEYDDLNSKARDAEKEVSMLQMKIEEVTNNLSKLHKDRDSRRRFIELKLQSIDQQSSIDSYFRVLDSAREKRDSQKSKYNMADGMRQMFDPFVKVARAHHICPCCDRPFSAEEEDEFVRKQRIKAASSAEHLKALAVETSNAESLFEQLDKLRMVYEECDKINKESIPLAEKNLNELKVELDKRNQALDDVLGVLAQIKADKDCIDALIQPVEIADRHFQEIQALQTQVGDLERKLDVTGQGVKTMEDIQSELDSLQRTKDCLQIDLDKLREEQRYMEEDQRTVQARWHSAREDKNKAANTLHNVERVEKELDRLAEQKSQVELDEKHLSEAVGPLKKESEKLNRHHDDLKIKLNHEYDELSNVRSNYQREVDEILKINSDIKKYIDSKKRERLKEVQEKHSAVEAQLKESIAREEELLAEQLKSHKLLTEQAQLKRNIEDNLNYRKMKADCEQLEVDIESLEKRIVEMGGISAAETEAAKLSQERERLLSELNRFRGTVSVYQSNITTNKVDLKQAQYKDIDKRYFDQLIQLKTTEMANKDLDRYYNALDKALMRFHTMKMEEINKIIRELWQQTYRGQDIDYISIHSDSEGAGTRSYSYRVIMQTGDAELEMRGRCSAGQKVLASLIIRLALAETFCLNCGILALDEPTTNLDGPNSESLAAALLRIMDDRKGQENFQLIVITHDERFAQLIGQRQHAEKYYRITKDDLQHSIIEAQEIFD